MKLNKNLIKLKHILNLHTLYDVYPTDEDILYFIIKWASEKNKSDMNFTNLFIYRKLGEQHKEKIDKGLNLLVDKEYIIFKKCKKDRKSYTLIKNPYLDEV